MSEPQTAPSGRRSVRQVVKDDLLFFVAPFITLACVVTFPFIAVLLLTRRGIRRGQELWHQMH
jgi:hypothetical protein